MPCSFSRQTPALSADPAAEAMIKGIYQRYIGKDAKGVPLDSPKIKALLTPGPVCV